MFNEINKTYIDDLHDLPLLEDSNLEEFLNFEIEDTPNNINGVPFNSNLPLNSSTNKPLNYIRIKNSLQSTINFQIIYTINQRNYTLFSGNFSPLYTRQLSIPKNISFLYLTINDISSSETELPIHHSSLQTNRNYSFNISGDIKQPILNEI